MFCVGGTKRGLRGASSKQVNAKTAKKGHPIKPPVKELVGVVWNKSDCAPQLTLSKDGLTVSGEKGYRMVRANVGVREGYWYYECEVLPGDGHVRLGWAAITGELDAPVGYDAWSYGYRDVNGARVHRSERYDGYGQPFGVGDVVGCLIYMAPDSLNPYGGGSFGGGLSSGPYSGSNEPSIQTYSSDIANQKNFVKFFVNGIDQV
jgi:hypothetical protein